MSGEGGEQPGTQQPTEINITHTEVRPQKNDEEQLRQSAPSEKLSTISKVRKQLLSLVNKVTGDTEIEGQTPAPKQEKLSEMTLSPIGKSNITGGIIGQDYCINTAEGQQIKLSVAQVEDIGRFYIKNIYSPESGTLNRKLLADICHLLETYAREHGFKTLEVAGRPQDGAIYRLSGFRQIAELPNKDYGKTPIWSKTLVSDQSTSSQ